MAKTDEALTRENLAYRAQLDSADNLTKILLVAINGDGAGNLTTLAVHVSHKDIGLLPNATYTYDLIRNGTVYDVYLLPELEGNLNATAMDEWILANFKGIPVVYPVFEGGFNSNPNLMQGVDQIIRAIASGVDVRMVRLAEIVSWHMDNNQTFPSEYVKGILDYCKQRGLPVLWSEWKISDDAMEIWMEALEGYEDIVTVTFQTNDEFDQPIIGYMKVNGFPHWGASVQAWYYETQDLGRMEDMPARLMGWHAMLAKNMGAELIQIEPYWYFFDDGEPMQQFTTFKIMVL